jgi:hypothetical protein
MFNHSSENKGFKELTKEDIGIDTAHWEGSFVVRIEKGLYKWRGDFGGLQLGRLFTRRVVYLTWLCSSRGKS